MFPDHFLPFHEKEHLTFSQFSNTTLNKIPSHVLVVTVADQFNIKKNIDLCRSISLMNNNVPQECGINLTQVGCESQFVAKLSSPQFQERVPQYDCATCHRKFFSKDLFNKHVELHAESLKLHRSLRSNHSMRKDFRNKLLLGEGPTLCSNNSPQRESTTGTVAPVDRETLLKNNLEENGSSISQKKRKVCDDIPPRALQAAKRYIKTVMLRKKQEQYLSGTDDSINSDEQASPIMSMVNGRQSYGCKVCKKVFYNKFHHREHYNVHSGEMPYHCEFCSKRFRQRSGWNRHIKLHHKYEVFSGPIPNPTLGVNQSGSPEPQTTHENIDKKGGFNLTQGLDVLPETKVSDNEEKNSDATNDPPSRNVLSDFNINNTKSKADFDYRIGETSDSKLDELASKNRLKNPQSCQVSLKNVKSSVSTVLASDFPSDLNCETKNTKLKNSLDCASAIGESFNSLSVTNGDHFSRDITPVELQKKGRKFRSGREKRFECGVCFRKFLAKSHLNDHKMIHTGELPYKCMFCSRPFRHKSGMNSHHRRHIEKGIYNRPIRSSDKDLPPGASCLPLRLDDLENELETIKEISKQKRKARVPKQVKQQTEEENVPFQIPNESVLQANANQRFSCNFCSLVFPIRTAYLKHMNNVHKSATIYPPQAYIPEATACAVIDTDFFSDKLEIKQELETDL